MQPKMRLQSTTSENNHNKYFIDLFFIETSLTASHGSMSMRHATPWQCLHAMAVHSFQIRNKGKEQKGYLKDVIPALQSQEIAPCGHNVHQVCGASHPCVQANAKQGSPPLLAATVLSTPA